MPSGSLDLSSVWGLMRRRRRFFGLVLGVFFVAGVVLSYVLPPTYTAEAVVLAPVENDPFGSLLSARRALSSFSAFGLLSQTYTAADEYQAILKSEGVHRAVAQRFNMMSVYHTNSLDNAVKALRAHVRINMLSDGTIAVQVQDRLRTRAADLANAFPAELERFNQERRVRRARAQLEFVQEQIDSSEARLRASEGLLRRFAETQHSPILSAEDKSAAEGAAALLARRAGLQIRRQILSSYLEPGNDELQQTDIELSSINHEIGRLPAIQLEGARLLRDSRIEEELVTLLKAQREQSRVREGFAVPTVELLDRAHPPDVRSSPKRKLVVAGMLLLGFAFALAGTFLSESRKRAVTADLLG